MTLQPGTVTAVADQWANVRQQATTAAPIIAQLRPGAAVRYDPTPISGGAYVVNGVPHSTWYALDSGYVAAGVITIVPQDVPAPAPYRNGVDISQAQTSLDWRALKAAGYSFALIRATQGSATSRPVGADTAFRRHIDAALTAGMDVGAYHTYLPEVDGGVQADFFHATIYPYISHLNFPLGVDVETSNGQGKRLIADRLRALCMTLEALTGAQPMPYTAPGWWDSNVGSQWDGYFATLPLWVAHWTDAAEPLLPRPWRRGTWTVWQHRVDRDGIPGYPGKAIDCDRAR